MLVMKFEPDQIVRITIGGVVVRLRLVDLYRNRAAIEAPASAPTLAELHARVFEILEAPHRKILAVLIEANGDVLDREYVGKVSGYEASGGTFNRYVSHLSGLGLVWYPRKGTLAAAEILFPAGLA